MTTRSIEDRLATVEEFIAGGIRRAERSRLESAEVAIDRLVAEIARLEQQVAILSKAVANHGPDYSRFEGGLV